MSLINAKPWASPTIYAGRVMDCFAARAYGPVTVETQDEDEVYMLQFGNAFGKGTVRAAIPLEEE